MLSNRNYYEMASVVDRMDRTYYHPDDLMLLYLPLAHNYGRLMLLLGAKVGFTIAFLADPLRIGEALPQVRPTILPSVPRVYEKVYSLVQSRFDEATGGRRRLIDWALAVGGEVSRREAAGENVPAGLRAKHRVADRLVFAKVREPLGGRLRMAGSGGAPLAREIAEFFDSVGVRITEGYGLTECTTACSVNTPDRYRFGSVGQPLPGSEIRIAPDGEIEVRSDTVFQGYYKDPEATAAVLMPDGWLHTGDIGRLDADGFLHITDRKKDILVTAGGKNVAPQNIENELKTSKYVSQALVVGDARPYVSALITLDPAEIERWAAEQGIEGDAAALVHDERVRALLQSGVDDVNRDRSRFEQVKRFAILPRDFTMEAGEITPTLKLRRRAVQEHFADEIDDAVRRAAGRGQTERGRRSGRLEAAGADVRAVLGEARDPDDVTRVRRVDELAAADVDPDVAEPAEEDEVAGGQLFVRDRRSHAVLGRSVMWEIDAHLRVDVARESRAVETGRGARAAPDVRDSEVLECDPHDLPVTRRRNVRVVDRNDDCLVVRLLSSGLRRELRCLRARSGLRGECRLPSLLLGSHLCDLALDGREQAILLGQLRLDRLLLRRLLGHDLRLAGVRLLEFGTPRLDFLAVALDRAEDLRVLTRHALDGVEPGNDVVEARRSEDHLERGVTLAIDVQVA